jgi:hypothetical protein
LPNFLFDSGGRDSVIPAEAGIQKSYLDSRLRGNDKGGNFVLSDFARAVSWSNGHYFGQSLYAAQGKNMPLSTMHEINPPSPPFNKGGLGGISEVSFGASQAAGFIAPWREGTQ